MLLNVNKKTAKAAPGWTIQGLELVPHRSLGITMRWLRDVESDKRSAFLTYCRKRSAQGAPPIIQDVAESYLSGDSTWARRIESANLCPWSTEACRSTCLVDSGFGTMPTVQFARLWRTLWYRIDRASFLAQLRKELRAATASAHRRGLKMGVRLNVFSDVVWEAVAPDVLRIPDRVYDYTKAPPSARRDRPDSYHLTWSWADTDTPDDIRAKMEAGNLAVPFLAGRNGALPATWNGRPVIDGDRTDARFTDPADVVVGLTFKGKAGSRPTTAAFGVKA